MKVKDRTRKVGGPRVDEAGADESAGTVLGELFSRFQAISANQRELLGDLVAVDRLGLWENDGHRSMPAWLGARLGISQWEARRWINAGYAMERLPVTAAALSAGVLSLAKTVELCRFATPETEKKLIKWARNVSPAAIRKRADSHDAAEQIDPGAVHDARYVRMWDRGDGAMSLEGLLPSLEGARVKKAIDRIALTLPTLPPEEDGTVLDEATSMDQKRADALALLASAHIANDQDPDRATVVAFLEENRDGSTTCSLEDGTVLHPAVRDRLLDDCRLQPVAVGKGGDIGIGRTSQITTPWLRRLVVKDGGGTCFFPGCEVRTFLQPHHLQHWTRNGPTQRLNLRPACFTHHPLFHEKGWDAIIDDDGVPIVFRPSGRRYEPGIPGASGEIKHFEELERERRPHPPRDAFEEASGIRNFELKETANGFTDDLYEIAKNLAGF
jgi:hypothetical protein